MGEKANEDQLDDKRVRFILEMPDMENCKASEEANGGYDAGSGSSS